MAWSIPSYSRKRVDEAGAVLLKPNASLTDRTAALEVISNWRASHGFPLNTLQMGLRAKALQVDDAATVAQRLKRLSSIHSKLARNSWLKLSRMQDIGGSRAIVSSVDQVYELRDSLVSSRWKHRLTNEDDYISSPKSSGYRGVHLVYAYNSDKNTTYNGLKIEVQLRTYDQHAWATAVETVGTFTKQALKASFGDEDLLRFFSLVGSLMSVEDGFPAVPGTPDDLEELTEDIRDYASRLQIIERLDSYRTALQTLDPRDSKGGGYYLLLLEPSKSQVTIKEYSPLESVEAAREYDRLESSIDLSSAEAVLVRVESLASLRRAYPNYFWDTELFLELLRELIGDV